MIKGITILRPLPAPEQYESLKSFLAALGFENGKGWQQSNSQGASFLAPLGNLEIVSGTLPSEAEVLIEVNNLDALEAVVRGWMEKHLGKHGAEGKLSPIAETDWKSRAFTVEPVKGNRFFFWEWTDPLKGHPLAVEGDLSAIDMRFSVIVSRWNALVTNRLLEGALDALLRSGAQRKDIQIIRVPGAWEIPAAAHQVVSQGNVDAIICLGLLLRGETAHYEAIYNEVSRGIGQSQQSSGVPHAFGVLTCDTLEQALDRAGLKAGNKGFEAAIAAIEMASLHRKLQQGGGPLPASPAPPEVRPK